MIIREIVINSESVDVIAETDSNSIKNIYQLDLEPNENEISNIFIKNNISEIINYPIDSKIVQALADNGEQLKDYLDTCRKAHYSNGRVDIPQDIPYITYDFKDLRESFKDIDDENLRINKQLQLYKQAKEMKEILRGKVNLDIGWVSRAYYAIQDLLHRNEQNVLALNAPTVKRESKWKVAPEIIEATNEISNQYVNSKIEEKQNEEEKVIE